MSQVRIVPDLFMGVPEFTKLIESVRDNGYLTLSKALINTYGVVIHDQLPDSLKLIPSSNNKITIKAGLAIDKDHNYIIVEEDLIDVVEIPDDSQEYYISISYKTTILEKGTVDVTPDGTLTGNGTEFLKLFRGENSKLPSRIKFFTDTLGVVSSPPVNPTEYQIASVENDELAYLNVVSGVLDEVSGLRFGVVGTFTPSIVIDDDKKFPFINDSYEIKVSTTDQSDGEYEFALGVAVNNNGIISVVDTRDDNQLSSSDQSISKLNPVAGVEYVKYGSLSSSGLQNSVKIGWGLISESGSWSIDSTGQVVVGSFKGGIWQDINSLTDEDTLVGWRVLFPDGKVGKILSVNISGSAVKMSTTITSNQLTGQLFIVPDCDDIEILINSTTNNTITKRVSFDCNLRYGIVEVESNSTVKIWYRHLKGSVGNGVYSPINDGSYIPETSFDNNGNQSSSNLETYTNATIDINRRTDTILSAFDLILPIGGIIEWMGSESSLPSNYAICDGRQITNTNSSLYGQTTPNYKGRVSVGLDDQDPSFQTIGQTGGEKTVALTAANNGPHDHTGTATLPPHTHPMRLTFGAHWDATRNPGGRGEGGRRTMTERLDLRDTEPSDEVTGTLTTSTSGQGTPHNNLQPYITVYKIMRIL